MGATDPRGVVVRPAQLEASFEALRAEVADPRAGLFGPGSLAWRLYGDVAVVSIAGPAILLLQSTHPYVAHAIQRHSSYRADPLGRAYRTVDALLGWVFSDLDGAIEIARDIRNRHNGVGGKFENDVGPYACGETFSAHDTNAMLWVHATLWYVPVQVYELLYGPLPRAEKQTYYELTKRFAKLFGIPAELVPADWDAFVAYYERMAHSEIFTVDRVGSIVARTLFTPAHPWVAPLVRELEILTVGLLPESIRAAHGLQFGPAEQRRFAHSMKAVGNVASAAPPQLRYFPAYRHAMLRMRSTPPSPVTRLYLRVETELIRELTWISNPALRRARRAAAAPKPRRAWRTPAALMRRASTQTLAVVYNGLSRMLRVPPVRSHTGEEEGSLAA